jgi:hypothetical protein
LGNTVFTSPSGEVGRGSGRVGGSIFVLTSFVVWGVPAHHPRPFRVSLTERIGEPKLLGNGSSNRLSIFQDIIIRKPNNLPALIFEEMLSFKVILLDVIVIGTVELDNNVMRLTCEVGKERADRMLTAELQTANLL